jgi:hypothetical protein
MSVIICVSPDRSVSVVVCVIFGSVAASAAAGNNDNYKKYQYYNCVYHMTNFIPIVIFIYLSLILEKIVYTFLFEFLKRLLYYKY